MDPYDGQPAASGGLDVRFGTREKGLQNAAGLIAIHCLGRLKQHRRPLQTKWAVRPSNFPYTFATRLAS